MASAAPLLSDWAPSHPRNSYLQNFLHQRGMHVLTGGCGRACTVGEVRRWHLHGRWRWDAAGVAASNADHVENILLAYLSTLEIISRF